MPKNRCRFVYNQWVRDPNGPFLKKPPPIGKRPPNQIVWGHGVDDFFWIQRIPGINVVTIWSRSMIQDFGENFVGAEHEDEPNPRQLRSWPILQLPPGVHSDPPLGLVDETCFCNHLRSPLTVDLYDDNGNLRIPDAKDLKLSDKSQMIEAREVKRDDKTHTFRPEEGISEQNGSCGINSNHGDFTNNIGGDGKESNAGNAVVDIKGAAFENTMNQKNQTVQAAIPTAGVLITSGVTIETRADSDECKDIFAKDSDAPLQPTPKDEIAAESKPVRVNVSLSALPKLEEFIPIEYFPDILLVNDPNDATDTREHGHGRRDPVNLSPIKYKRVLPKLDRDTAIPLSDSSHPAPRIAHLNLASTRLLGSGHHSHVYRASLRLPEPLIGRSPNGEVTVAAKMAFKEASARELLNNEARIYDAFPRHLMEHWCGLNLVMPITYPVPVGAVVPKFYGYYAPETELDEKSAIPQNYKKLSPILLLEECGTPVDPYRFSADERSECYSLLLRLHHADFLQQSLYTRNILVQPGPLTKPPSQRSNQTPSFRIIDFGRGEYWKYFFMDAFGRRIKYQPEADERAKESILNELVREWFEMKDYEVGKAHDELIVKIWEY